MTRQPPRSDLFPYTTLFESKSHAILKQKTAYEILMRIAWLLDRKSTRLNSSHLRISYAVFCLKKKKQVEVRAAPRSTVPYRSAGCSVRARGARVNGAATCARSPRCRDRICLSFFFF